MKQTRTSSGMSIPKKSIVFAGVALLALVIGLGAGWVKERMGAPRPPHLEAATALLDQARPLPAFSLIDEQGEPFDNARLKGHWSFVFFGYTHCPDICPSTLSTLDTALRTAAAHGDADRAQVVFVSVDPRRDNPATLKDYVKFFNPEFTGVTGNEQALGKLTRSLGVIHMTLPRPGDGNNYLVDHSASVLLIGPQGRLVALFGAPHRAKVLASDFHKLRGYYERS